MGGENARQSQAIGADVSPYASRQSTPPPRQNREAHRPNKTLPMRLPIFNRRCNPRKQKSLPGNEKIHTDTSKNASGTSSPGLAPCSRLSVRLRPLYNGPYVTSSHSIRNRLFHPARLSPLRTASRRSRRWRRGASGRPAAHHRATHRRHAEAGRLFPALLGRAHRQPVPRNSALR
ncbi:hypothetical protein SBA6_750005 [Candidatus Sulfopaludibacter sp. SbA6]|nr:hypothetical protein SBA6_750005 [Candidatus Sulfopaludibacter sp. SbA6]